MGFPSSLIHIEGRLSGILREWERIDLPRGYALASIEHEKKLCDILERQTDDKALIYSFITIPFDERDERLLQLWHKAFQLVKWKEAVTLQNLNIRNFRKDIQLEEAERQYKEYDLVYACLEKYGNAADTETVMGYKQNLSKRISEILKSQKLPFRTCRYCGKKIAWNHPYGMCTECYEEEYGWRRSWHDDYY